MTWYWKILGFVDLLIACAFLTEQHAGIFSLDGEEGFFTSLSLFSHTPPSAHQFIRLLRGSLSPEETPWVGVCNFWWMNTSLTHSSFIWLFNHDALSLSLSMSRLFHHWTFFSLSGLCSSLKTVVADLIGLCWTLALCCFSYDHLWDSLSQTSCEVRLCNTLWALVSQTVPSLLQVFPGTPWKWVYNSSVKFGKSKVG